MSENYWLSEAARLQAAVESEQRKNENLSKRLAKAKHTLHLIGTDYVELSHDKVHDQRNWHMKIAMECYQSLSNDDE